MCSRTPTLITKCTNSSSRRECAISSTNAQTSMWTSPRNWKRPQFSIFSVQFSMFIVVLTLIHASLIPYITFLICSQVNKALGAGRDAVLFKYVPIQLSLHVRIQTQTLTKVHRRQCSCSSLFEFSIALQTSGISFVRVSPSQCQSCGSGNIGESHRRGRDASCFETHATCRR